MTKTDTWRRLVVETREGVSLLFDPSQVFYLEVDGHDTLVRTARKRPSPAQAPGLNEGAGGHSSSPGLSSRAISPSLESPALQRRLRKASSSSRGTARIPGRRARRGSSDARGR